MKRLFVFCVAERRPYPLGDVEMILGVVLGLISLGERDRFRCPYAKLCLGSGVMGAEKYVHCNYNLRALRDYRNQTWQQLW